MRVGYLKQPQPSCRGEGTSFRTLRLSESKIKRKSGGRGATDLDTPGPAYSAFLLCSLYICIVYHSSQQDFYYAKANAA